VLREHLEQILASEGVPYEPSVLPVVIRSAAGSVRDALSVLDQLVAGSDEGGLRYDRAIALLGYTDDRLLDEVVAAFSAGDGAGVFHAIDHVVEAGHDARRFATDLLDRLRDLIVLSAVPDAASTGLIDAPADRVEQMAAQAAAFGQNSLTRAAEIISAGLVEMRGATSPRLLLELMCAQVLLPGGSDTASLAERLDRLERELRDERSRSHPPAAPRPSAQHSPAQQPQAQQSQPQPRRPQPQQPQAQQAKRQSAAARPPAPEHPAARPPATEHPAVQPPPDTETVRARWPDVLDAVQGKRRVAWMLLSNAVVESLADGALTIAFAKPGDAKGFVTSGSDKDLSHVMSALFGMTPQIRTTVLTGGAGAQAGGSSQNLDPETRHAYPQPAGETRRPSTPRPADDPPAPPRNQARQQASAASQPGRPASPRADSEPEPSDLPAPDVLTGTDLIARELGGRIIQELDGS
jgi:DNA polymerase-3 subunit gamma/tau